MKLLGILVLAPLAQLCNAAPISYTDILGPSSQGTGIVITGEAPPYSYNLAWNSSLNGTGFNGQDVRLDVQFNGFFVRAYTQTEKSKTFLVDMFLPYLPFWGTPPWPPPGSPSITGTATLLDAAGHPVGSPFMLNEALDGGPTFQADVQLSFRPQFSITPADIYGIQYDLHLSNSLGKEFSVAPRQDMLLFYGFFGVGPGIPAEIVPDQGPSLVLLALAILAILCVQKSLSPTGGRLFRFRNIAVCPGRQ